MNNDEGHTPTANDPQWYKDYWHGWYAGDACDTTGVTAATKQSYTSNLQNQTGCYDVYVGGITSVSYSQLSSCKVFLQDAQLDEDSTISSRTGFHEPANGASRPAACYCPLAISDKSSCVNQNNYNCQFAVDGVFPSNADTLPWYRLTTETYASSWLPAIGQELSTIFQAPIPGSTSSTSSLFWNPFYNNNGWSSDVSRMGFGSATDLKAVLWTHTRWVYGADQPPNLGNNYVGIDAKLLPGRTSIGWLRSRRSGSQLRGGESSTRR